MRLGFVYLTLVVAAFMVGLGNLWKFPSLIVKYGMGGLVVYIAFVVVLIGMLATAIETTKKKGYEIMEYFSREYGKPAFALLFLVFDILLIGYYSIVGGWIVSSMVLTRVPTGMAWNTGMAALFILSLLLILLTGKERTMDFMVVSFLLFAVIVSLLIWWLCQWEGGVYSSTVGNILTWRGLNLRMVLVMASQAAYSLGVGMGFYLLLGSILPRERSGTKIIIAGATLDTLMALGGLMLISALITVRPSAEVGSTGFLFESLPMLIKDRFGTHVLYAFNFSLLLAAITSMIPIGEVTGRITSELLDVSRNDGIIISLALAAAVAEVISIFIWFGFDPVGILDRTISTFILFGGIIEAYAAVRERKYVPWWLRVWAWVGVITVAFLGLYSFLSRDSLPSSMIIVGIALPVLALNGVLERKLSLRRKQLLSKHYY